MMDIYPTKFEELQKGIGDIHGINQNEDIQEGIYLFFSFDLVNSTAFKTKPDNAGIWPIVITHFYELIQEETRKEMSDIVVWKYLGDEILLYFIVDNIEKIYECPRFAYKVQEKVLETLHKNFGILSCLNIKSTLWIAGIKKIPSISLDDYKNYEIENDSIFRNIEFGLLGQHEEKKDFLGQDIDIGFRIAKYANKNKVTLSVGLAYLLYKMKIVSFEYLKGVWDNRAYPIIWYYPDWNNVMGSFDYDEYKNNEIIKSIYAKEGQDISELENILEQLGMKKYHNKFNDHCLSLHKDRDNDTIEVV